MLSNYKRNAVIFLILGFSRFLKQLQLLELNNNFLEVILIILNFPIIQPDSFAITIIIKTDPFLQNKLRPSMQEDDENKYQILNNVVNKKKNSMGFTIISSIFQHFNQESVMNSLMGNNEISEESFEEVVEIKINRKDFKRSHQSRKSYTLECLDSVTKIFAPEVFKKIQGNENILDSLNLTKNIESIKKIMISAGKSQQFFFSSYDNKLIIKSIKGSELKTLLKILRNYFNHFQANPQSLIARIFGVFQIHF